MSSSLPELLVLLICIALVHLVKSRIVPAKTDICNRYPGFGVLCQKEKIVQTDVSPSNTPSPPLPPTPPPAQNRQSLTKSDYCTQYSDHYAYFCDVDKKTKNPEAAEFCSNYPRTCPVPTTTLSDMSTTNLNEEEVLKQCREKASLARSYCTGNEARDIKPQCDNWRKYCANNPKVNPTATNDPEVARICVSYQYMADQYCPGYESVTLRQYCNYYRVYCQGKKPFPNIDGNVGIVTDNWGVGGIPFYPFNPQGAIAGGQRIDVGFGDWGADYNVRKGITDFYEDSDQFAANWQRGNYGGGKSWNVPLVGIGGYNRNGVSLGGIANFVDLPGLLSGGVPLGAPLSGLGQIPLSKGLPVPQSPGGVTTLSNPVGTGNLGLIGALVQGAPIGSGPIGPLAQFTNLGGKK